MSIAKNASRFDFLTDDADDPFQTGSKKNKKKDGSGSSGDAKKKTAKKGNGNSDRKQLQSLAFGSVSEGKKKNKVPSTPTQQNDNLPSQASSNNIQEHSREQRNGNSSEKNANRRPVGISDEQWEEWQKRDADFMDEAYATELQTALLQSKLQYETEQKNKPPGKGKKKKPMAVPLTEFNARLNEGGASLVANNGVTNGTFNLATYVNPSQQLQQPYESDEELVERFRMEARVELERERQKALERQLLMSRQPPPPIARPSPIPMSSPASVVPTNPVDEKDLMIRQLTDENLHLKSEVDLLKTRLKTINSYLEQAQEVKDKAKLIYELDKGKQLLDNMSKANSDLNDELREMHSQLEQEKSRSSAAMLELRRLLENRRRTTTEGSTS